MEDRQTPSPKRQKDPSDRAVDLDRRLKDAQARAHPAVEEKRTGELGMAMRVAVDLVAGLAVGTVIGWALDRWLGTGPWLLILFFVLGAAAGIRNVFRTAQKLETAMREKSAGDNEPNEP